MNALWVLAAEVGSGKLEGGWEYVWGAYGVFWVSLALYGASLLMRTRELAQDANGGEP